PVGCFLPGGTGARALHTIGDTPTAGGSSMLSRRLAILGTLLLAGTVCGAAERPAPDLSGRTALVTGSTSGLGETVARRLGALGATVIIHGLNEEQGNRIAAQITRTGPGRAVYYPGDFSSLDEVRALAQRVRAAHPRLHLLINN